MKPPPCCLGVLGVLTRAEGRWVTTGQILREARTTCIHKRLSELISLGLVEKVSNPYHKGRRLYRIKPGVKIVAEVAP